MIFHRQCRVRDEIALRKTFGRAMRLSFKASGYFCCQPGAVRTRRVPCFESKKAKERVFGSVDKLCCLAREFSWAVFFLPSWHVRKGRQQHIWNYLRSAVNTGCCRVRPRLSPRGNRPRERMFRCRRSEPSALSRPAISLPISTSPTIPQAQVRAGGIPFGAAS